jgi:hypothetical protein
MAAAALLYVVERAMERKALPYLCWNAAHTIVRPVAGALLGFMALEGLPELPRAAGAFAAGALTLAAHMTRSGWGLLLALLPAHWRVRLLISVAEDVGAVALLSLLLDAPLAAVVLAVFVAGMSLVGGRAAGEAFAFALRLLWTSAPSLLREGHWFGPDRFPRWIRRALKDPSLAPGGGLRGSPAGAVHLPDGRLFHAGWVVVRGGSPLFLRRARGGARVTDLGTGRLTGVHPSTLHTRVEFEMAGGQSFALYFGLDGPGPDDLLAEFSI